MDESVGVLVDRLETLGLAEDTIVIVVSDNGGLESPWYDLAERVTSNAPLRGQKGTLYEGGVRVPMIVRWPGVTPKGIVIDEPTITNDLLPTLAEIAGATVTSPATQDGRSLARLLADPSTTLERDALYFHYPHYHHSQPSGAIRRGPWKLIEFFDSGKAELYNLAEDPGESLDLATQETERVATLRADLESWRREVGARMPTANPEWDTARAGEWWHRSRSHELDLEQIRAKAARRAREPAPTWANWLAGLWDSAFYD